MSKGKWKNNPKADNPDYYYDEKSKQYRKKSQKMKDKENGIEHSSKYAGNPDYYYDETKKKYKKIRKHSKYADNPDYYFDEKSKQYRKRTNGRKQSRYADDPDYYKDETTGKWKLKCIEYTRDNPVLIFWNSLDCSDITVCDDKLLSGPTTFNHIRDFIVDYHQKYGPIKGRNVYVANPQKFLKTLCRYSKKEWSKSLTNPNYKSHIMININHVSETYYEINTLLTKNTDIFYEYAKTNEEAYNALYTYAKHILSMCHTGCTTAKIAHNLKMIDTNPTKNTPELLKARCGSIMPLWDIKGLPKDLNDTLRPAFYGGINYVNYDDIGKELKNLTYLDRNSAYPYVDANMPLPVGLPEAGTVNETLTPEDCLTYGIYEYNIDRTLSVVKCTLVLDNIEEKHMYNDCFHLFNGDRLITKFNQLVIYDMLFSTLDLHNLAVIYKGCLKQVEINYKWTFRTKRGIYRNFVQKHYEKRQQLKRELENLNAENKYDEALQTNIELTAEKSLLNFSTGKDAEKFSGGSAEYNGKYLPIAIFRTAWQRLALCKIINYLGEHFKYGDTDSAIVDEIGMKMLNDIKQSQKILSLGTELGQWKCVDKIDKFRVLGHKLYGYVADTKKEKIVIAGFSTSLLRKVVNYNNFNYKLRVDMNTVKEYGNTEDIAKFTKMCFTDDDIYYTDKCFSLIQKERFTPGQKELLKLYA